MNKRRKRISGGQAAVQSLKKERVKHVFGIIGSATLEMFDALYHEKSIKFIGEDKANVKSIFKCVIYTCKICDFVANSESGLLTHYKITHLKFLQKIRNTELKDEKFDPNK